LCTEISIAGEEGEPERWEKGKAYPAGANYALCRCGRSGNQPFCDGTHTRVRFDGTEQAGSKSYAELAEIIEGPDLDLADAESLCASARFCEPKGGTWRLTLKSGDPVKKKYAIQQACNCPSGRLVAYDKKTGEPIEPDLTPSLSLTEDPEAETSGPIWVKGGVTIESERGGVYETRNRVTLCRCGRSENKPFCDGSHIRAKFNDGDESLNK
jgi:CDGSH-type Zn-finger protein